jgi:hypothetical protein
MSMVSKVNLDMIPTAVEVAIAVLNAYPDAVARARHGWRTVVPSCNHHGGAALSTVMRG